MNQKEGRYRHDGAKSNLECLIGCARKTIKDALLEN
jgi:hypothetical protein